MRYTTIIDITEYKALYRNANARLVYLHLVLISGYHDYDRDVSDLSIRNLAREVGLTISATRHALEVLQKYNLLARSGPMWMVKKWVVQAPITARAKTQKAEENIQRAAEEDQERKRQERKRAAEERKRQELLKQGKTPYMVYYEELMVKASKGDAEAQRLVQQNRIVYEGHKEMVANELKKQAK